MTMQEIREEILKNRVSLNRVLDVACSNALYIDNPELTPFFVEEAKKTGLSVDDLKEVYGVFSVLCCQGGGTATLFYKERTREFGFRIDTQMLPREVSVIGYFIRGKMGVLRTPYQGRIDAEFLVALEKVLLEVGTILTDEERDLLIEQEFLPLTNMGW